MKEFYVLWTYAANYSKLMLVKAETAEDALKYATFLYGKDFHAKATVMVFSEPPTLLKHNGERMQFDRYQEANRE